MSIRFRLTLLYTAILALTLIVFGVALYSIQAQDTLSSIKRDLLASSEKLIEATLRVNFAPPPQDAEFQDPPPPKPSSEFPSEQAFRELPEREIVRVLDENGELVASPFANAEDVLPLSQDGLAALQNQQEWWESNAVSGENMLIYNRPIVRGGQTIYIVQIARFY